jgi:hypothetical protein
MEKLKEIILNLTLFKIIQYILGGFAIVTGLNFLFFPFSQTQSYPITLQIQENEVLIFILGGVIIIIASIYAIFREEFALLIKSESITVGKIELSDKMIKLCREHSRYKENTNNPELRVITFNPDDTILVHAPNVTNFLTKNLKFILTFQTTFNFENNQLITDSLDIADCYFLKSGKDHAIFKIKKWVEIEHYKEQIQKLRSNQDLINLRPIIKLAEDKIADSCSFNEMETFEKTIQKFRTKLEEA